MIEEKPPLDPNPLSDYVAWAGKRNREPLLQVLKEKMPRTAGKVLEMATGSGMHINYFAPHFPRLQFQPSDKDDSVFENIKHLTLLTGNQNIDPPVHVDLTLTDTWLNAGQPGSYDVIFCINIFQVAPVSIADGMMECAANLLADDGFLLIYGPFQVEGRFTTESNQTFHETLSAAGVSEWGLKDVADLQTAAAQHGLELKERIEMPANNFSLIFGRI